MAIAETADNYERALTDQRRSNGEARKEKNRHHPKKKAAMQTVKSAVGIVSQPIWIMAFAAGIACDLADVIVIAAWPITLFVRPFLLIFLLFHGSWGRKVGRSFLLLLDFVPVIGFIPFSTCCVIDAYLKSQKKKKN